MMSGESHACLMLCDIEVRDGNDRWVYNPYSGIWHEWPKRVVLCGLRGQSVKYFHPKYLGEPSVHHNLNMMLPVKYLGLELCHCLSLANVKCCLLSQSCKRTCIVVLSFCVLAAGLFAGL